VCSISDQEQSYHSSAEADMGRIRLAGLIFASLGLLLSVSQEAAAQSSERRVKSNEERGDSPSDARLRPPRPQPRPRGPEIFYCETPDTSCRTTQDTFPIADLRDLFVFVVWPGVSGQHVQTVEFLLPGGSIYSSKKTRFSIGGALPVAAMAPASKNEVSPAPPAPHLIAEANKVHAQGIPTLLMKSRGDSSVLTVLPVGGTYITQRNLSGTWRVRVLLDDRLALESEFTLVPREPPPAAKEKEERDRDRDRDRDREREP
jgi:hypothetical protein